MHEMKFVIEIIKNIEKVKSDHKFKRIKKVNLLIGEFSGIDPQALHNSFLMASQNSPFADAVVECQIENLKVKCRQCSNTTQVVDFDFKCANCNSRDVIEAGGRGVFIQSVEGDL